MPPSLNVQVPITTLPCMLTGKALFAFAAGVVVAAAIAMHYFGSDAMRALGRMIHGG
jgi:hypothetical protein